MLRVNGGAVLLSYFRTIIATLTMQAGVRPINLPFVILQNNLYCKIIIN